ncbi:MAG: ABC transporter substrate-binding protein [Anaerolineae bacterium]|nr:ABC transporter substrate-binding protein [Anaerolineae bacterium]
MIIYIGLDDTDVIGSPGTGHLARLLAGFLAESYPLLGVTRHQLLEDSRVRCTKKNSSAGIMLDVPDGFEIQSIYPEIERMIVSSSAAGSDPGLCITSYVPPDIIEFGYQAKRILVNQQSARELAHRHHIILHGLGGDESGIIGALAAVGLDAEGNDGRYVLIGQSRTLMGLQPITALIKAGISGVQTFDGKPVLEGDVLTDQLRPARRNSKPIAVVEWAGTYWIPLKLD